MRCPSVLTPVVLAGWLLAGCAEPPPGPSTGGAPRPAAAGRAREAAPEAPDPRALRERLPGAPPFDPLYFQDPDRRHLTLFLELRSGRLHLSDRPAEIRPGRFRLRPREGPVEVVFRDRSGRERGRYRRSDPRFKRVRVPGERVVHMEVPVTEGPVEIPGPNDPTIAILEIALPGEKLQRFDVESRVLKAIDLTR